MDDFFNLKEKIYNYILEKNLLENGDNCIVGISGGADSVCLLKILSDLKSRLGISLYAVHVNHMIRGAEAEEDEQYTKEFCKSLEIPCKVFRIDVRALAKKEGVTVEEAGRDARYHSFNEAAEKFGLREYKIAVAHNKNDAAETVILNMSRGTGISGIKGIPVKRDNIVRPLLCAERKEIEAYLIKNNVDYKTDSTNLSDDYTRNKIRHNILPELEGINARAVAHIGNLADTASEYDRYVNLCVNEFIDKNCTRKILMSGESSIEIDIAALRRADKLIENMTVLKLISEACKNSRDIGENHLHEIKKLYDASSGSFIMLPYGVRAVNSYGRLCFVFGNKREQRNFEIIVNSPGIYTSFDGGFSFKIEIFDKPVNIDLTKKEYTKLADYDKIQNGIAIRNYKKDDYMVIASDGSVKKINRLFSSCKIPREERAYIPLVVSGHEVIWAVGVRLAENYKVSKDTKKVIRFDFEHLA